MVAIVVIVARSVTFSATAFASSISENETLLPFPLEPLTEAAIEAVNSVRVGPSVSVCTT
jgi:hypothetical protein